MAQNGAGQRGADDPDDPLLLTPQMHEDALPPRAGPKGPRNPHRDRALGFRLFLVLLVFAILAAGASLKVKALSLPVLAVAEVEERLNRISAPILPGVRLSLGGIELMLDQDWAPVFRLKDLTLLQGNGTDAFLALPEARMALDGASFLTGQFQPKVVQISGAHVNLTRDINGRINLQLGDGAGPSIQTLAQVFDGIALALALPEMARMTTVEFDALGLTLFDERLQKSWDLGDGRLVAENRANEVAAELAISVLGQENARATVTAVATKGTKTARLSARISDIPANELAAQHPILAWLAALDAPISGDLTLRLQESGVDALEARLALGAGALQPSPQAAPIAFTRAGLTLAYDPNSGRIDIKDLSAESRSLRALATGQVFLLDAQARPLKGALNGRRPAAFLGQFSLKDVRIDPEGLFEKPVQFSHGALDLRLTPDPFAVEIGQFTLVEGTQRLTLKGTASAEPGGWLAALDLAMNAVTVEKLMQLWPLRAVPKTRAWAAQNILTGDLTDLNAALRIAPGADPRLHLDYDFAQAEIRFMANLPPIRGGTGYSVIEDKVNTVVLTQGTLTPPQGGTIDITGSSMKVLDIYAIPARAQISLRGDGPAEAMLSILDQKPFEYLKKAGRPVALGQGRARVQALVSTPLAKAKPADVTFEAQAQVIGFQSDVLVPGRRMAVPDLTITADKSGLTAQGAGTLDGVPFDGRYRLPFGAQGGDAAISGTVEISPEAVEAFDLGLPRGMVKGTSQGQIEISLPKGEAPRLSLTSGLQGTTLSIPELGWTKSARAKARLEVEARLSDPPQVSRLDLTSDGLDARGKVSFRDDGRLDRAEFSRVVMGGWLDGAVTIRGSNPLAFAVTSGAVDFREFPSTSERGSGGAGSAAGSPLSLKLSEFRVTDSIRLTGFRGDFTLGRDGVNGQFSGNLGGEVPVSGGVAPDPLGTGIRVVTADAGAALRAAGIFDSARGGSASLRLTPRREEGVYDGRAEISDLRVKNANVLAELLNAISVIGLLEQLNGSGIVFNRAEADFVMTPEVVTVQRSSAVGASMGVSLEGTYNTSTGKLRMGGVVSPIYLLNGIGAILTRKGEGLFGFSYRLGGTADAPVVGVNPLSILTPGMFREIFRMAPPKAEGAAP